MDNKYGLPEGPGWDSHIADSNTEVTITLDRMQLWAIMNQIHNGCANEFIRPVYEATYRTIASAFWGVEV